jgi:hypothetical protein
MKHYTTPASFDAKVKIDVDAVKHDLAGDQEEPMMLEETTQ